MRILRDAARAAFNRLVLDVITIVLVVALIAGVVVIGKAVKRL